MSEILKSSTWNQKKSYAFFSSAPWFFLFLEIFTTLLTMQCPKCLFHMENHKDQVKCVTLVEKVSRWDSSSKNIYKKNTWFFWLLVEDIKISNIFYKIQNFQGTPWASIIATCLIKLLRTGPFRSFVAFGVLSHFVFLSRVTVWVGFCRYLRFYVTSQFFLHRGYYLTSQSLWTNSINIINIYIFIYLISTNLLKL